MEELWGCVKYIGLSWDMVMSLPIQDRKYYIQKHNYETQEASNATGSNSSGNREYMTSISGEEVNKIAERMQQSN